MVAVYTGKKGDTEKDRALTEAQSLLVRDYLAQNFKLDDTRLKTIGLGKDDDDHNRVEILVIRWGRWHGERKNQTRLRINTNKSP